MKLYSFVVLIEQDQDGYFVASVPDLPGCHTQAKTLDELMKRTEEASQLYLESKEIISKEVFVGVQQIKVEV